jgi:hypothetical protein
MIGHDHDWTESVLAKLDAALMESWTVWAVSSWRKN